MSSTYHCMVMGTVVRHIAVDAPSVEVAEMEAMKEWKADHASAAAPLREPAPPAVVERSADLAAELWAACMELANARLAGEREALEVAREEMEASQREAAELADQMAGDIEALQAQVSSLQVRAESAESEIDDMRAELAAALERAGRAEARAAEIEKRADDAKTELGRMHELLSEERKQHAAELERQTAINEDVVRYMTIRVEEPEEGPSVMMRKNERSERRPRRDRD